MLFPFQFPQNLTLLWKQGTKRCCFHFYFVLFLIFLWIHLFIICNFVVRKDVKSTFFDVLGHIKKLFRTDFNFWFTFQFLFSHGFKFWFTFQFWKVHRYHFLSFPFHNSNICKKMNPQKVFFSVQKIVESRSKNRF